MTHNKSLCFQALSPENSSSIPLPQGLDEIQCDYY